ncbi:MAG: DUF1080 domain-containing protein [Bacteroidota bacterium]|nr:DUF1080 domain-containing protein [Bacteroidota bacterium]
MLKTSIFTFCIVAGIFCACSSAKHPARPQQANQEASQPPNTLSSKEKKDGWILLFDGQTTAGWHGYNKTTIPAIWKIVDGSIMLDPKARIKGQGGDLVTDQDFENYEFSTEWRISEEGNSGIIFNVKEDKKYANTYSTGLEMQVLDNIKASDNKKPNHLAGLLYDLSGTADLSKPKPVGQWNEARIIQKKGHLTLYFNGIKTFDMQEGTDEWKSLIENSKFKGWQDFAATPKGKIAFQDHGHEVAFRNVKIRTL